MGEWVAGATRLDKHVMGKVGKMEKWRGAQAVERGRTGDVMVVAGGDYASLLQGPRWSVMPLDATLVSVVRAASLGCDEA